MSITQNRIVVDVVAEHCHVVELVRILKRDQIEINKLFGRFLQIKIQYKDKEKSW